MQHLVKRFEEKLDREGITGVEREILIRQYIRYITDEGLDVRHF